MELDERASLWLSHLKTWQHSGSTQEDYCRTNGLNPKTFSNWKRRLRDHLSGLPALTRSRIVPSNPVTPLVAVSLADDLGNRYASPSNHFQQDITRVAGRQNSSGIILSFGDKYQISLLADFDSAALRRLFDVLIEVQ